MMTTSKMKRTSKMRMTLKMKTTSKMNTSPKMKTTSKMKLTLNKDDLKKKEQHFHAKTTSAKHYIYIGVGSRDLFIDEAHTALGMFPVSFPCMLSTPLCGNFILM